MSICRLCEFLYLDPADLADVVKQRVVLDTRNVLAWPMGEAAGFEVLVLGNDKD
jgi:hypothetical protein